MIKVLLTFLLVVCTIYGPTELTRYILIYQGQARLGAPIPPILNTATTFELIGMWVIYLIGILSMANFIWRAKIARG